MEGGGAGRVPGCEGLAVGQGKAMISQSVEMVLLLYSNKNAYFQVLLFIIQYKESSFAYTTQFSP